MSERIRWLAVLVLGVTLVAGVVGLALIALFTDRSVTGLGTGIGVMFLVVALLGGLERAPRWRQSGENGRPGTRVRADDQGGTP